MRLVAGECLQLAVDPAPAVQWELEVPPQLVVPPEHLRISFPR
jgi:hypothetical protein